MTTWSSIASVVGREPLTQHLLWNVLRADAIAGDSPFIDRVVDLSRRHGVQVCRVLGDGVLEALALLVGTLAAGKRPAPMPVLFEQSLTVLYRVLFLLFAEARGLLPLWHPVYRDRYSLDTIVTALLRGQRYRGLWQAVQAISRLAHAGCSAGELRVTAFNGRLFSPSQADAFDRTPIADTVMGQAVVAVSTTPIHGTSQRTCPTRSVVAVRVSSTAISTSSSWGQFTSACSTTSLPPIAAQRRCCERERCASRAAPSTRLGRSPTSWFARRSTRSSTAAARRRSFDSEILDPAMGSGAFLVAACRYLSAVAEEALIEEGTWHAHDVGVTERAMLRREVASRCLFGVDLNPMAVQLARLSLWLATLATDKPLSFLDHHLVAGNSLVGASPDDLRRQPAGSTRRGRRQEELPLFPEADLSSVVEHAIRVRLQLTMQPDDTAAIVREKERTLAALNANHSSLTTWSRLLDLWCAGWFWTNGPPPDRGTFRELAARLLDGACALPERICSQFLNQSDTTAARRRFHHWPLVFPEIFLDEHGHQRPAPGFDAIIGNPPWEMVRGDSGDEDTRALRKAEARQLTDFVRESGIYRVESSAHANLYQLFVERALQLVRRGGRVGLVLPSGIVSDAGTAPLRRHLFDRAEVDAITGLDNREAIFPIHRSTRFVLLTCTPSSPTQAIRCRFGITRVEDLERGESGGASPLTLTRAFIQQLSGADDLGIPELSTARDLAIVERISARVPRLGDEAGWCVQFSRELNASDDRHAFVRHTGEPDSRPIVEGKQIEPFRVWLDRCHLQLDPRAMVRRALPHRARLAYRDVASATNRLTLIAAIIPARAVTTHTLFCLKNAAADRRAAHPLRAAQQLRRQLPHSAASEHPRDGDAHVTSPGPCNPRGTSVGRTRCAVEGAHAGDEAGEETEEYAQLQALCAHAYQLRASEFEHILGTFPLIPAGVRAAALAAFNNLH